MVRGLLPKKHQTEDDRGEGYTHDGVRLCQQTHPQTAGSAMASRVPRVLWPPNFALRASGLAGAIVLDPATMHPYWASVFACIRDMVRATANRPQLKREFPAHLETA